MSDVLVLWEYIQAHGGMLLPSSVSLNTGKFMDAPCNPVINKVFSEWNDGTHWLHVAAEWARTYEFPAQVAPHAKSEPRGDIKPKIASAKEGKPEKARKVLQMEMAL